MAYFQARHWPSGAQVEVPGYGTITYDLAFGGNFYAIVAFDDLELPFDRERKDDLLKVGLAVMKIINKTDEPVHPERSDIPTSL